MAAMNQPVNENGDENGGRVGIRQSSAVIVAAIVNRKPTLIGLVHKEIGPKLDAFALAVGV